LTPVYFARLGFLGSLPLRLGVGLPVSPHHFRFFSLGGSLSDLSCSQRTLSCVCPALRPRSDLHAKPVAALRCCPRCQNDEGSSIDHYFEAQSHGFRTAPYASCRHRWRLRNVRFRLVANLCRVGLFNPLGPCIVFPSLVFFPITCPSSHSGFSWRDL